MWQNVGPFHGRYDAYVAKKRRPVLFGCWRITAGARDANQASRAAPFKHGVGHIREDDAHARRCDCKAILHVFGSMFSSNTASFVSADVYANAVVNSGRLFDRFRLVRGGISICIQLQCAAIALAGEEW